MATTSKTRSPKKKAPGPKRPVTLTGDKVKPLILRVLPPERELLYEAAEAAFRTINAHVMHMLKVLLQDGLDEERIRNIIAFDAAMHEGNPVATFSVRLPLDLHAQLKDAATEASAIAASISPVGNLSVNCILRYAVLKHQSEAR